MGEAWQQDIRIIFSPPENARSPIHVHVQALHRSSLPPDRFPGGLFFSSTIVLSLLLLPSAARLSALLRNRRFSRLASPSPSLARFFSITRPRLFNL
jgi:hypothetical protein